MLYSDELKNKVICGSSGRQTCSRYGLGFKVSWILPGSMDGGDVCGSVLARRAYDHEVLELSIVKLHQRTTEPLVDYYQSPGIRTRIAAMLQVAKRPAFASAALN